MAKVEFMLPNGTKVQIEGTAEEVATLAGRLSESSTPGLSQGEGHLKKKSPKRSIASPGKKRDGLKILIEDLVGENYFKSKRTIGNIKAKLEEKGHIYPWHRLSTPLLRLTRSHVLRRFKEKGGWVYVS